MNARSDLPSSAAAALRRAHARARRRPLASASQGSAAARRLLGTEEFKAVDDSAMNPLGIKW